MKSRVKKLEAIKLSSRQVTLGIGKCLSYLLWRRTLEEFDNSICSPATVFTLCDLPNKDESGIESASGAKVVNILQKFVKAKLS